MRESILQRCSLSVLFNPLQEYGPAGFSTDLGVAQKDIDGGAQFQSGEDRCEEAVIGNLGGGGGVVQPTKQLFDFKRTDCCRPCLGTLPID